MLTMSLSVSDLASLRLAISPAWETVASLRVLRDPAAHAVHLPWVKRHREHVLSDRSLRPLVDLVTSAPHHLPGFLAPAPTSPVADPAAEIRAVGRMPAATVRDELAAVFGDQLPDSLHGLRRAPRRELAGLVTQLEAYWRLAVAPYWERMRAILEGDVVHRARQLADRGPQTMLGDLHPAISWKAGELRVDLTTADREFAVEGRELVLVPSLFAWPDVYAKANEAWAPVLRYPCRGVGRLWETRPSQTNLSAALGRTRALLLDELESPATTTQLAYRTGLAQAGVSVHLSRLAEAGLVSRHRSGRAVLYARTDRGEGLYR